MKREGFTKDGRAPASVRAEMDHDGSDPTCPECILVRKRSPVRRAMTKKVVDRMKGVRAVRMSKTMRLTPAQSTAVTIAAGVRYGVWFQELRAALTIRKGIKGSVLVVDRECVDLRRLVAEIEDCAAWYTRRAPTAFGQDRAEIGSARAMKNLAKRVRAEIRNG